MNPSSRIILDIGTGDGQSTDDHIRSTEYSYVFVEPDQSKRQSLKSQLRVKQILTAPRQVLQFLSQLKTGKAKYAIVNCKLDDLLDDPVHLPRRLSGHLWRAALPGGARQHSALQRVLPGR